MARAAVERELLGVKLVNEEFLLFAFVGTHGGLLLGGQLESA